MKLIALERAGSKPWPEQAATDRLLAAEAKRVWDDGGALMKILAVERPEADSPPGPIPDALLEAEARRLWKLRENDVVREAYFRADRREAVLVLELPTIADAVRVLESLPLVAAGFINFEVMGLRPYDGFARLFSTYGRDSSS